MGGHHGESLQKKAARLVFWQGVEEYLGEEEFRKGRYLCLASHEAGDVGVLHSLGVPYENIVLSERDEKAAELARQKYPLVPLYCEDVLFTVHRFPAASFAAIYLDYCGVLSEELFIRTRAVAHRGLNGGRAVLGVAVHASRETDPKIKQTIQKYAKKRAPEHVSFYGRLKVLELEMDQIGLCLRSGISYTAEHTNRHVGMVTYVGTWNFAKPRPTFSFIPKGRDTNKFIGEWVAYLQGRGVDLAEAFNISKKSFPAFKAHLTRGTYR